MNIILRFKLCFWEIFELRGCGRKKMKQTRAYWIEYKSKQVMANLTIFVEFTLTWLLLFSIQYALVCFIFFLPQPSSSKISQKHNLNRNMIFINYYFLYCLPLRSWPTNHLFLHNCPSHITSYLFFSCLLFLLTYFIFFINLFYFH